MRDSAEISGTSMNRSTEERWKSVARSGVWTSVMVVSGGRTNGRLESFPLTMTKWEVEVVMSGAAFLAAARGGLFEVVMASAIVCAARRACPATTSSADTVK